MGEPELGEPVLGGSKGALLHSTYKREWENDCVSVRDIITKRPAHGIEPAQKVRDKNTNLAKITGRNVQRAWWAMQIRRMKRIEEA